MFVKAAIGGLSNRLLAIYLFHRTRIFDSGYKHPNNAEQAVSRSIAKA